MGMNEELDRQNEQLDRINCSPPLSPVKFNSHVQTKLTISRPRLSLWTSESINKSMIDDHGRFCLTLCLYLLINSSFDMASVSSHQWTSNMNYQFRGSRKFCLRANWGDSPQILSSLPKNPVVFVKSWLSITKLLPARSLSNLTVVIAFRAKCGSHSSDWRNWPWFLPTMRSVGAVQAHSSKPSRSEPRFCSPESWWPSWT